jgi:choline transport protein
MSNDVSCIHLTCTLTITSAHYIVEFTHGEGIVEKIQLKGLSLQEDVGRQMTKLETISASWVICDSWAGIAGTISLAIAQGGPVTLVYGPVLILILVGCCALTLAELASVYPTAGGQYHWTSILAPKSMNRALVSHCGKRISPCFLLTG